MDKLSIADIKIASRGHERSLCVSAGVPANVVDKRKHQPCSCGGKDRLRITNDYQFFCGINLGADRLTNYKIVSEIRCELGKKLNIDKVQRTLFDSWRDHIGDHHSIVMDATCYESELRYPTNEKLLWESVDWSYRQLKAICKSLGIKTPRTKYLKWKKRNIDWRIFKNM